MVKHRLQHYLDQNNIINPDQSGFTPGHSTSDNLAGLEQDIKTGQLDRQHTVVIFLDFSKAFVPGLALWANTKIKNSD